MILVCFFLVFCYHAAATGLYAQVDRGWLGVSRRALSQGHDKNDYSRDLAPISRASREGEKPEPAKGGVEVYLGGWW